MSTTVQSGAVQISLAQQETIGGHTIGNHVGQTEQWLRQRLLNDPAIPAANTFPNVAAADNAVNQAIQANFAAFTAWLRSGQVQMQFDHDLGSPIGRVLTRSALAVANQSSPASKVRVIIRKSVNVAGHQFYVLTAFPIP